MGGGLKMLKFEIVVGNDHLIKTSLSDGIEKDDIDPKKVAYELYEKDCWGQLVHIKNDKILKVEGCLSEIVKEWFNKNYPNIKILQ